MFRIWIERPRNVRITPSGHPMPTPDRRHVPKTIIWGVISPPVSFHVSVEIRSVPAVVAQLVGRVGFDFLMPNFPGFEPRVGVLFPKSGFGGSGFASGSGGGAFSSWVFGCFIFFFLQIWSRTRRGGSAGRVLGLWVE